MMGVLSQGLSLVYKDHGHQGSWLEDRDTGGASGNPLVGNEDLQKLLIRHNIQLSVCGKLNIRPKPFRIRDVCEDLQDSVFLGRELTTEVRTFTLIFCLEKTWGSGMMRYK